MAGRFIHSLPTWAAGREQTSCHVAGISNAGSVNCVERGGGECQVKLGGLGLGLREKRREATRQQGVLLWTSGICVELKSLEEYEAWSPSEQRANAEEVLWSDRNRARVGVDANVLPHREYIRPPIPDVSLAIGTTGHLLFWCRHKQSTSSQAAYYPLFIFLVFSPHRC